MFKQYAQDAKAHGRAVYSTHVKCIETAAAMEKIERLAKSEETEEEKLERMAKEQEEWRKERVFIEAQRMAFGDTSMAEVFPEPLKPVQSETKSPQTAADQQDASHIASSEPKRKISYVDAAYLQAPAGGSWKDINLPEGFGSRIEIPTLSHGKAEQPEAERHPWEALDPAGDISSEQIWQALLQPTEAQEAAPSVHGRDACVGDEWMPVVHPGLLAHGHYMGKKIYDSRPAGAPQGRQFESYLRNPDQANCYPSRIPQASLICNDLALSRARVGQWVYSHRLPQPLSDNAAENRPFSGWIKPLPANSQLRAMLINNDEKEPKTANELLKGWPDRTRPLPDSIDRVVRYNQ